MRSATIIFFTLFLFIHVLHTSTYYRSLFSSYLKYDPALVRLYCNYSHLFLKCFLSSSILSLHYSNIDDSLLLSSVITFCLSSFSSLTIFLFTLTILFTLHFKRRHLALVIIVLFLCILLSNMREYNLINDVCSITPVRRTTTVATTATSTRKPLSCALPSQLCSNDFPCCNPYNRCVVTDYFTRTKSCEPCPTKCVTHSDCCPDSSCFQRLCYLNSSFKSI